MSLKILQFPRKWDCNRFSLRFRFRFSQSNHLSYHACQRNHIKSISYFQNAFHVFKKCPNNRNTMTQKKYTSFSIPLWHRNLLPLLHHHKSQRNRSLGSLELCCTYQRKLYVAVIDCCHCCLRFGVMGLAYYWKSRQPIPLGQLQNQQIFV